jgi:hypothetical protein
LSALEIEADSDVGAQTHDVYPAEGAVDTHLDFDFGTEIDVALNSDRGFERNLQIDHFLLERLIADHPDGLAENSLQVGKWMLKIRILFLEVLRVRLGSHGCVDVDSGDRS